jgi:restriction system protein
MKEIWHYPQDLFDLLVDTIPRLCRSKQDVILFLQGAALPDVYYADLAGRVHEDRASINKFEIVRTALQRINDADNDRALKARRDVVKRVIDFEDFASCWESDRLAAQGLVEQVRKRVNQHDAFAKMQQQYERERRERQSEHVQKLEAVQRHKEAVACVLSDLRALFAEKDPHQRGKACEGVLNRLFEVSGLLVRNAFVVTEDDAGIVEQIDGAVEIDARIYLVEMKWWAKPVGRDEIASHLVRVFSRAEAHAICISASPYTEPAVVMCREALRDRLIVLCTLEEVVLLLEQEKDLSALLRAKINAAITHKNPFHEPLKSGEL